jgi:hypothetical protein
MFKMIIYSLALVSCRPVLKIRRLSILKWPIRFGNKLNNPFEGFGLITIINVQYSHRHR